MNPERALSGFADVNGTRLYYEAQGRGAPLLLLHGFTFDRRMWRPQLAALSEQHLVVSYDARGFGRSALPSAEQYRHCDDAAALCAYLELDPVVAVGHSIGAHQLLELALSRPELVRGFVAICMAGLQGVPFTPDLLATFGELRAVARERSVDAAKRIWAQSAWFRTSRENPDVTAAMDEILADYSGWHWTHDNPAVGLEPAAAKRLAELRIKSLVITGGRDVPYSDDVARAFLEGASGATELRLASAGHMANMDAPSAVNRAILDFAAE
jgi:pimeloyl-ACP methyl ester carboxylesterase